MKYVNVKKLTLGVGLMALTYNANALGTAAGTSIANQASVDYVVGGVNQTDVNSNSISFLVDRRVSFTVVSNGNENVVPAEAGQVLAYTITNTGNDVMDFSIAASDATGDDFNVASSATFVETAGGAGYQAVSDTDTFVDELAADGTKVVYIVSTMPASPTAANGLVAKMHLMATARLGGTASSQGAVLTETGAADVAATVENVFGDAGGTATGDAANDGKHSDDGDYNVVTAVITVTKSDSIISDPINGTGANRKRIPGAIIEYTLVVANSGAATADSVAITDTVNSNMDTIAIQSHDSAASNSVAGQLVSATWTSIAAAASKTLVFRATIKNSP